MIHTIHSKRRTCQRGILNQHMSLLFKYGSVSRAPGGVQKVTMRRKDIEAAVSKRKKEIQMLSNLSGLTAILNDDKILTVYKRH